ncbi:hypothetical protein HZC31_01680 [Candidatus Woesearchaeota archaeon]|nr:hypothetical protein [Candidatus Woesearchaeota archaeon]
MKFFWTIEKIELFVKIYKELAKQDPKRRKEFEEKAKALVVLIAILKQIPENRRSMGMLAGFLSQVNEEVNPPKKWFSFSNNKSPIPLSVFTDKITLFQQFKEQLEIQGIAAK